MELAAAQDRQQDATQAAERRAVELRAAELMATECEAAELEEMLAVALTSPLRVEAPVFDPVLHCAAMRIVVVARPGPEAKVAPWGQHISKNGWATSPALAQTDSAGRSQDNPVEEATIRGAMAEAATGGDTELSLLERHLISQTT